MPVSTRPKNIIFLVADSLRYDAVHERPETGLPYVDGHSTLFTQARSAGCWTLPATASMFTGLLPHEHGADSQTRHVTAESARLADRMKAQGYRTIQLTANPATTHIFGLDRGFDEMHRIWTLVPRRHGLTDTLLSILARPRVRKKLFTDTEDFISGKLSEDVNGARSWMQSNAMMQFDMARDALRRTEGDGGAFLFINLMESHFPYHIADTFEPTDENIVRRTKEIMALFHLANQTRLKTGKEHIDPAMLQVLRGRQRRAWTRLAPMLDAFVREMHEDTGNMVVLCSDHGDNFGEQGWEYHFSNVNDAGNRTALWVLHPEQEEAARRTETVSMRDLYGTLLRAVGDPEAQGLPDLTHQPERSLPIVESFWYNKDGQTRPEFRYNQFAFLEGNAKYVQRNDTWLRGRIVDSGPEPCYETLPSDFNPWADLDIEPERRREFQLKHEAFRAFSEKVGLG